MTGKAVLAIGLDPRFADFSAFPELSPELVRAYIDAQVEGLRTLGYDASSCWVDRGETAAEGAGGLFIVERRQRAGVAFIDHKAHGVRADIQHRHRPGALNAALSGRIGVDAPEFIQSLFSSVSRGKALPRPDRLAWVMK